MIIFDTESHSNGFQCHLHSCHYKSFPQYENIFIKYKNKLCVLFLQSFVTFFPLVAQFVMAKRRLCVWEKPPGTPEHSGSIGVARCLPLQNYKRTGNSMSFQDNCFHSPIAPTVEDSLQYANRILMGKIYNTTAIPYGYNTPHS